MVVAAVWSVAFLTTLRLEGMSPCKANMLTAAIPSAMTTSTRVKACDVFFVFIVLVGFEF